MVLSKQTLLILRNFSRINKSIILGDDNCIKTMSLNEAIIGVYMPPEGENFKFKEPVGIYDLPNFIATAMSIGSTDVEFDFSGEKILMTKDSLKLEYGKTELELIQNEASKKTCEKLANFNEFNATTTITNEEFKKVFDIGRTMNFDILNITQNEIKAYNSQNPLANTFSLVKKVEGETKGIKLLFDNLLLYPGSYKIDIADDLVVKFTNLDIEIGDLFYYIAPVED